MTNRQGFQCYITLAQGIRTIFQTTVFRTQHTKRIPSHNQPKTKENSALKSELQRRVYNSRDKKNKPQVTYIRNHVHLYAEHHLANTLSLAHIQPTCHGVFLRWFLLMWITQVSNTAGSPHNFSIGSHTEASHVKR